MGTFSELNFEKDKQDYIIMRKESGVLLREPNIIANPMSVVESNTHINQDCYRDKMIEE
jgi:hypothetical protein